MRKYIFFCVLVVLSCFAFSISSFSAEHSRPNVIFFLTDDLGYSDLSCYGATKVDTPNIDRLAAEGVKFTDFHTGASICSPSRAAFLTGAYPQRCGLYMGINENREEHWFLGLNPGEITLAEQFKKQDYRTFMIGKWHLGVEPELLPMKQGFDHYYGMPSNFAHSPKFFDDEVEVHASAPLEQLTKLYTDRAVKIIRESSDKPFFLFFAHNYPHIPYKAGADFIKSSKDGMRGDVIQELDWGFGEMVKALEAAGIAENTIIVFSSDNGATANQYCQPFSGTKYVSLEGGHRVPFIFHWPALVKRGVVSDTPVVAMDLFPTLSEIIGEPLPADRIYDGVSLMPLLTGGALARPVDQPFFYYNCENLQAVRYGDWKLHLPRTAEQVPWWDKNKAFFKLTQPVLYNLRDDVTESKDVAAQHPEIVGRMVRMAEGTRKELGEYMQRGSGQRPTGSAVSGAPIISNGKDWNTVDATQRKAIAAERLARHPDLAVKSKKSKANKSK